ncbi:MAG: hypothetical protein GWO24_35430, partial [Akkermansiaceae bacterium]|nr:hypothetical protein [Akkermansiaceae bacterium]NIS11718.1 hypothetical protein [Thermoplasmata archaeon]NIT76778.1 hypothetical protein [Thermoplasmata archaeon]NIY03149.1 hypothetical protein [Thermoplasmata archaeon]
AILDLRFGKKRVAYDLNDPEANNRAVAAGYTIVTGGALSGGEWANVKRGGAVPPAGKVAPSSKVLNKAGGKDDAYPEKRWTDDMRRVMAYTFEAGGAILGKTITVRLANRPSEGAAAWYGDGRLTYNVARLGRRWFKQANDAEDLNRLLIHECAHELEGNHLSDDYHDACCTLGARLARLWRDRPEILETKAGDFAPNMTSVLGLGGL